MTEAQPCSLHDTPLTAPWLVGLTLNCCGAGLSQLENSAKTASFSIPTS
ncbi:MULTISPECIES: hypothetical protein [unclassified Desulfovibrio]|nr:MULTISPECIES: hypothetical protein [unclassified Desulfovibrio]